MKRILYTLLAGIAVLLGNYLFSNGTIEANVETPTPVASPTLISISTEIAATNVGEPTIVPSPAATRDPYGEVYFLLSGSGPYYPLDEKPVEVEGETPASYSRLMRLPGSCVTGLMTCPVAETISTPFNTNDIFSTGGSLLMWSPDGRYGALVIHAQDELSMGRTKEQLEKLQTQSPSEFDVNPSTIYMFDAQSDTWQVLYQMERKYIYTPYWSPDGQWIAFNVNSSVWGFHAQQADDGIYVIRPDGSDLRQVSDINGYVIGWLGNSLILRHPKGLYPVQDYSMDMLTLNGELKSLFETSRTAFYALAPDGGELLVADAQGEFTGSPAKAVDVLALDGTVIHTFGTFTNYTSSIYPFIWSPDGSMVAFANQRRVYVAPRNGPGVQSGLIGVPPDDLLREVYAADDTYTEPSFWGFEFSADNKYLMMNVSDGEMHFVTVNVETKQVIPLEILGMSDQEQPNSFSWRH